MDVMQKSELYTIKETKIKNHTRLTKAPDCIHEKLNILSYAKEKQKNLILKALSHIA